MLNPKVAHSEYGLTIGEIIDNHLLVSVSLIGEGEIVSRALGKNDSEQQSLLAQYQEVNENNKEIKNKSWTLYV